MLIVERGYRGMDTTCKSVTFAAEIVTWLDSNRLDLQGQQVGGGHQNFYRKLPLDDIILDPSDAWGLPCL